MTALKICGITRITDAEFCVTMGVDFIGVVLVPTSKRFVVDAAGLAIAVRGSDTKLVGVFQNQPNDFVRRTAENLRLDYVQLHGDETDADIEAIGFPVIKAIRRSASAKAAYHLYDAPVPGNGRIFDWTTIPNDRTKPIFLAGGINAGNVNEAIRTVKPDAIDVSTGVEVAPGIKNHDKIRQLIERMKTS